MTVEAYVAECVNRRGITIAELARRCGIEKEPLRRSLAETRKLKGDELVRLMVELDIEIKQIATATGYLELIKGV